MSKRYDKNPSVGCTMKSVLGDIEGYLTNNTDTGTVLGTYRPAVHTYVRPLIEAGITNPKVIAGAIISKLTGDLDSVDKHFSRPKYKWQLQDTKYRGEVEEAAGKIDEIQKRLDNNLDSSLMSSLDGLK